MPILTAQERIGTVLDGKYRLDRVLGEGGMGVVYDAMHVRLDRRVAVKFLHAHFSQSNDVVTRFVREAQATSKLVHPNVVAVHDVDVSPDGCVFMVLEFLHGQSLAGRLDEANTISPDEMFAIIGPVCDALALAHAAGIVHRDIKPDNVFLSRGLGGSIVPKVLDFGIAKLTQTNGASGTQTGAVMGTPLYMSPEQAMGRKDIGPAADQWSVAVMAYEALAGRAPFDVPSEPSATMIVLAVITGDLHPLKEFRPELGAISDALERAIQREPSSRYASVSELSDALRVACRAPVGGSAHVTGPFAIASTHVGVGEEPPPRARTNTATPFATPSMRPAPDTTPSSTPRGWMFAAIGAALLVAIAIAGVMLGGPGSPQPASAGPVAAVPSVVAPPSAVPTTSVVVIAPPPDTEISPRVPPGSATPPVSEVERRPHEPRGVIAAHPAERPATPTTATVATTMDEHPAMGSAAIVRGGRESAGAQGSPPASVATPPPTTTVSAPPPTTTHRAGGVSLDQF